MNEDLILAVSNFYKKYAPEKYSEDKVKDIVSKYGDRPEELINSLFKKYKGSELAPRDLTAIFDKYNLQPQGSPIKL